MEDGKDGLIPPSVEVYQTYAFLRESFTCMFIQWSATKDLGRGYISHMYCICSGKSLRTHNAFDLRLQLFDSSRIFRPNLPMECG